jgi:hypothetical protein
MSNKYEAWWKSNRERLPQSVWGHRSEKEHLRWFEENHLEKNFPVGTRVKVRGPAERKLPFSMGYRPREHYASRKRMLIASREMNTGVVIAVGQSPGFAGVLVRHDSGTPKYWDYRAAELVNLDARERVFGKKK